VFYTPSPSAVGRLPRSGTRVLLIEPSLCFLLRGCSCKGRLHGLGVALIGADCARHEILAAFRGLTGGVMSLLVTLR